MSGERVPLMQDDSHSAKSKKKACRIIIFLYIYSFIGVVLRRKFKESHQSYRDCHDSWALDVMIVEMSLNILAFPILFYLLVVELKEDDDPPNIVVIKAFLCGIALVILSILNLAQLQQRCYLFQFFLDFFGYASLILFWTRSHLLNHKEIEPFLFLAAILHVILMTLVITVSSSAGKYFLNNLTEEILLFKLCHLMWTSFAAAKEDDNSVKAAGNVHVDMHWEIWNGVNGNGVLMLLFYVVEVICLPIRSHYGSSIRSFDNKLVLITGIVQSGVHTLLLFALVNRNWSVSHVQEQMPVLLFCFVPWICLLAADFVDLTDVAFPIQALIDIPLYLGLMFVWCLFSKEKKDKYWVWLGFFLHVLFMMLMMFLAHGHSSDSGRKTHFSDFFEGVLLVEMLELIIPKLLVSGREQVNTNNRRNSVPDPAKDPELEFAAYDEDVKNLRPSLPQTQRRPQNAVEAEYEPLSADESAEEAHIQEDVEENKVLPELRHMQSRTGLTVTMVRHGQEEEDKKAMEEKEEEKMATSDQVDALVASLDVTQCVRLEEHQVRGLFEQKESNRVLYNEYRRAVQEAVGEWNHPIVFGLNSHEQGVHWGFCILYPRQPGEHVDQLMPGKFVLLDTAQASEQISKDLKARADRVRLTLRDLLPACPGYDDPLPAVLHVHTCPQGENGWVCAWQAFVALKTLLIMPWSSKPPHFFVTEAGQQLTKQVNDPACGVHLKNGITASPSRVVDGCSSVDDSKHTVETSLDAHNPSEIES